MSELLAGQASWWQRGIIYQIYPRSFQDRNGDGIGDLAGIASRLDHLVGLGVDALWLSPIYPSPMADFGYDVSDYCDVDPIFGRLEDLDRLIAAAHERGLKLILDLVPNHTSDRHPWFLASRSSRQDPKRDWYIWRDPAPDGGPPNNWRSAFAGSAWTYDPASGQYYYHAFLEAQPDLNWRNPLVREAVYAAMRFWLERGVDGFRVDVIYHLIKDAHFRDNPPNPDWRPDQEDYARLLPVHTVDQPEVQEIVREMRAVVDAYLDRVLIGEIYLPLERLVAYYGTRGDGAHLPFNFQLIGAPWSAAGLASLIEGYEAALPRGAWPNWVLGNHDQSRLASRLGPGQARVAAMLLLTLRGTPTLYYGDEIGMTDVPIPQARIQDPFALRDPGKGLGRDPERTPMPWDASNAAAGFTTGRPWLPLADDARARNVAAQAGDPRSLLSFYRQLIALRRAEPALSLGGIEDIQAIGTVLAYTRAMGSDRLHLRLNLSDFPQVYEERVPGLRVRLSTVPERATDSIRPGPVEIGPGEGLLLAEAKT